MVQRQSRDTNHPSSETEAEILRLEWREQKKHVNTTNEKEKNAFNGKVEQDNSKNSLYEDNSKNSEYEGGKQRKWSGGYRR